MTKNKKRGLYLIGTVLTAVVGGLLFGEFLNHNEILLAAITVICAFGIGWSFIVLLTDAELNSDR
jgi:hypothetical protein